MTTIAYFDCPTGIAGDMCLGALVHAGVPLAYLTEYLSRLGIAAEYRLSTEAVDRNGFLATKFHVDLLNAPQTDSTEAQAAAHSTFTKHTHSHDHNHPHDHDHPHDHPSNHAHTDHAHSSATRHLNEIESLIAAADLPDRAKSWSLAVFRQLAEAEAAAHGISVEAVHFHEVGATDAIVDIVGTCLGLDWLGIDRLYCSALPTGGGTIWTAHGRLPVPTPAVLKLAELRQIPLYHNGIDRELVTPTGAALMTTLADRFGHPPAMILQKVGLGAGSRNLSIPNILRLWIGEEGNREQGIGNREQGIGSREEGTGSRE